MPDESSVLGPFFPLQRDLAQSLPGRPGYGRQAVGKKDGDGGPVAKRRARPPCRGRGRRCASRRTARTRGAASPGPSRSRRPSRRAARSGPGAHNAGRSGNTISIPSSAWAVSSTLHIAMFPDVSYAAHRRRPFRRRE